MAYESIVILTGSGISAESGVPTFRTADGLWFGHRPEEVATLEAFAADPQQVHAFYNARRRQLPEVQPNAAHLALAELAMQWPGEVLLVTQNVDDLHERAYGQVSAADTKPVPYANPLSPGEGRDKAHDCLIHMHGELKKGRCLNTGRVVDWEGDMDPACGFRPHIVWFGEMPLEMEVIYRALRDCDLFIAIGTSGHVYPAAGFVDEARHFGARTVELNLEPSMGAGSFHEQRYGPATQIVPAFVSELMSQGDG